MLATMRIPPSYLDIIFISDILSSSCGQVDANWRKEDIRESRSNSTVSDPLSIFARGEARCKERDQG